MNKALAGSGGETMVKLAIAEALQGKRIMLLPISEGGMNLKTTNMNSLIETLGVKALAEEVASEIGRVREAAESKAASPGDVLGAAV